MRRVCCPCFQALAGPQSLPEVVHTQSHVDLKLQTHIADESIIGGDPQTWEPTMICWPLRASARDLLRMLLALLSLRVVTDVPASLAITLVLTRYCREPAVSPWRAGFSGIYQKDAAWSA